jgi:hypothetical protein
VVWVLSAIYESDLASKLTFKGGASLSKVYRIIDRFSEDVDLTYDIRELAADLLKHGNPIPDSASQEKKISSAVRHRLPDWIEATVKPVITAALAKDGLDASLTRAGKDRDKLILSYPAVKTGTGYSAPTIQLEFGARATVEPHHVHSVRFRLPDQPARNYRDARSECDQHNRAQQRLRDLRGHDTGLAKMDVSREDLIDTSAIRS